MISIIIPIYNEQEMLATNQPLYESLSAKSELLFADGESTDASAEIAKRFGKVIPSPKGRGVQMNRAARNAAGDLLLFLHADTYILEDALPAIEKAVQREGCVGGCLTQRIDKKGMAYRWIESEGNMRARISKVFYGDQGIFVRKDIFLEMGGFPEAPIMEDVLFTKKMRTLGKTTVLPNKIFASPRRWEKNGVLKTTLLYNWIHLLFRWGISPEKIKCLYGDLR